MYTNILVIYIILTSCKNTIRSTFLCNLIKTQSTFIFKHGEGKKLGSEEYFLYGKTKSMEI